MISGTLPEFYLRLKLLLRRNNFKDEFIEREMEFVKEGNVISKTNSKSILASMNVITKNIEYGCSTFESYEIIDLDAIEDSFMGWLTYDPSKPYGLRCASDYWKEKGLIK